MGIIEELASLRGAVETLTRAVGRHSRIPEQRWGAVTTCTSSDLRVTFPGESGEAIITHSTEAVWNGAQVLVQVQGSDRWIVGLSGATIPAGFTGHFAGSTAPPGWLVRDGSAVSRATYWRLYAALGGASSVWGQGDGTTTFNLPNAINRTSVGAGGTYALGATGGEAAHALTGAENGAHSHQVFTSSTDGIASGWNGNAPLRSTNGSYYSGDQWTSTSGSGTAHNNMQPYLAEIPIIKF